MEKYLKDNLDFLTTVNMTSVDENFLYQLNQLNASDYNTTQKEIYNQLNLLYDKLRVMEDVNDYLMTQIKTKTESSSKTCESLLKEIEKSRDAIKETSYHTIPINITPTRAHYDRDGLPLKSAFVYDGKTISAFSVKHSIPYEMKTETNKRVYHNNVDALPKGEVYRSYYITDESYPDGISENIQFIFQQPTQINRVATKVSNATSFDHKLHYSGDTIILKDLSWDVPIYSESASFYIRTLTFKEESFKCDTSRITADALSVLEREIYKNFIGEASYSEAELDELLGINNLKKDYQIYLQKVEDWQKRRKQVADANIKNGYADSIPSNTIVKLPEELGVNDIKMDGTIVNETIDTSDILPSIEIFSDKDDNETRIVYVYDRLDEIYPSIERYRYDFLDPSSSRYYEYPISSQMIIDQSFSEKNGLFSQSTNKNEVSYGV